MRWIRGLRTLSFGFMLACFLFIAIPLEGWAQTGGYAAAEATIQALFLSDIHFEPFFDP
jgi:hypothetical protein